MVCDKPIRGAMTMIPSTDMLQFRHRLLELAMEGLSHRQYDGHVAEHGGVFLNWTKHVRGRVSDGPVNQTPIIPEWLVTSNGRTCWVNSWNRRWFLNDFCFCGHVRGIDHSADGCRETPAFLATSRFPDDPSLGFAILRS